MDGIDISMLITITGIIGIIFNIISVGVNKKILIIFALLSNIFFATHYSLIGAYSGALSCVTISLLALIVYMYHSRGSNTPELISVFFICIFILSGVFNSNINLDGIDLLPILSTIINLYALNNKSIKVAKFYYLIICVLWIVYDLNIPIISWENITSQTLVIIFNIVTFLFPNALTQLKKKIN
ncbi:MAG: YgjV family protein [Methanobrevibacter sp.]|jgi:hypothetical protein|nr:YgjV family protein [Candidatus Methanovirga meridionalis]